jgi:hypothetical protein
MISPHVVRRRKKWRAVIVVPDHRSGLAPHLRRKNFYPIVLHSSLNQQTKDTMLPGRTLVTDRPEELADDDVPVLEFSIIDISKVKADEMALADMISRAWTKFHLTTEGCFVLRMRSDGQHQIDFPE